MSTASANQDLKYLLKNDNKQTDFLNKFYFFLSIGWSTSLDPGYIYVTESIDGGHLSAGPPGLICVTVRGRHLPGSTLAPPRNVMPNVPPESRTSVTSSRLHSTENDICSETASRTRHVIYALPARLSRDTFHAAVIDYCLNKHSRNGTHVSGVIGKAQSKKNVLCPTGQLGYHGMKLW